MIIAHEIYPGHYLQLKIGASEAPALRTLFGNGVYIEGWGTFSEELMLDAGWDDHDRFTRLAHLRKRLENATRAYVSVMVHVEGWNRDQVMDFAVTRGLAAAAVCAQFMGPGNEQPVADSQLFPGISWFQDIVGERKKAIG